MIVTAHSPVYFPSVSVMRKLAESDAVLWLDEVRYTTPGWQDRCELPDGTWLTVPVEREGHRALLGDVRILGDGWQQGHIEAIRRVYADVPHLDELILGTIDREWTGRKLIELTLPLNRRLLRLAGISIREAVQSNYRLGGRSISERLVRAVVALGGDVYLSGPGGWRYLAPEVFEREGVELRYHGHTGPNPVAIDHLFRSGSLDPVIA